MRSRASGGIALAAAVLLPGCRDESDVASRPPFVDAASSPVAPGIDPPKAIVFIVIDTLRADHLGCYGDDRGLTPVIDRLAGASHRFENAIATSSWTRPSVASMFASRYPSSLRVEGKGDALAESERTLAEELTGGGYDALGVYANGNVSDRFGFGQGFARYEMPPRARRVGYPGDSTVDPAESVTESALRAVAELTAARGREATPLFLFVHYVDPHDPYMPHPELMSSPEPPGRFDGARASVKAMDKATLTDDDRRRIKWLYESEVRYCDRWIGRLIAGLGAALGSFDDVMLVLTADHGEGLWQHRVRAHGRDLYDEQVRVPLLVHYPGQQEGEGSVIDAPVGLVDIAPTILAAAGLFRPVEWQGFDLRPLIDGRVRPSGVAFTELRLGRNRLEAIRTSDRKLIRDRTKPSHAPHAYQRFDVSIDPGEQLFLSGEDPSLRETLRAWSEAVTAAAGERVIVDMDDLDEATLENLRALGYIGDGK